MGWYDLFALTYDRSLEALYRPYREQALARLQAQPGTTVLDVACGTGQNFDLLVEAVGEEGLVIGVDLSMGMLKKARQRIDRAGWQQVQLTREDAQRLSPQGLEAAVGERAVDHVLCTLGLSTMPDWEAAFRRSFDLLRPGGRFVIMDVFAENRTFQTWTVELLARADLSRRVWEPLARQCSDFERTDLDASPRTFGGRLFIACGTKGAGRAGFV